MKEKKKTYQWPKRHQMRRLGPFSIVAFYMYYKILVSVLKYMRERKKNSPRAQTMPYASFEPILVVATLHCSSVCILELIYAIKFLLVAKNTKKKKNTHQVPKRRIPHCLGPFCSLPPSVTLPIAYFVNKILYIQ